MTNKKFFVGFTAFYFVFFIILLIVGSINDLNIEIALFKPESAFAKFAEIWGEVPRFAMWAPAACVLFFNRMSLADIIGVLHRIFPFIKTPDAQQIKSLCYKIFNFIANAVQAVGFVALAVLGCDKVIRNVGKYYVDLSQLGWYIISAAAAAVMLLAFSKIPKRIMKKLEIFALAGIVMGILFTFEDSIKGIANRVRFREMVAFSNGYEDARAQGVTSALVNTSDFSLFTNWYEKGNGGALLGGFELGGSSCPSGHVVSACFSFLSAALLNSFNKLKKLAPAACVICFLYVCVLSFTRIVRGAHFLSDVALGAMLGMILFLIGAMAVKIFKLMLTQQNRGAIKTGR
ncbi:MAG: phosphatase PAP2 family protein [Clostridiales bacterium]|nr:phosphatase PAP2 family protein [Clostridiales bacterium]